MIRLSVVVPCYNEAGNVTELHRQLSVVLDELDLTAEMVFVDDGSGDETLERLRALAGRDPRVQVLSLSRNFGHQAALSAGIDHARGQAVVVMDADLQHPPALIGTMVERWEQGYELVYAYREGVRPRLGYRVMNRLMRPPIPAESADFRLMDRKVVDAFRQMPERTRFIRGMVSWLGFKQVGVGYRDRARHAGLRAYTVRQTAGMALNALLSFSVIPLRLASLLGFVTLLAGLCYAGYILYAWVAGWPIERGWTGLMLTILVLGGVQLISLGIIAEYIGRILEEVKHRPLYVVRERIGSADTRAGDARAGDAQAGDARAGDARAGDARAGDASPRVGSGAGL